MNLPPPSQIRVNGEVLAHAAIAAEVQNHPAPKGKPGRAWQAAARALVIRALLLQEARRRGLAPEPEEVGPGRFETEEEALIREVLAIEVAPEPPDEAEIRAAWARAPSRFRAPDLWDVSHILRAADPRDAAASRTAEAEATALAGLLATDPDGFARLAGKHSDCPSRGNGGGLGQIGPGDTVPEFERAVAELDEGGVTPTPVQTRFGYHLIRLNARAVGQVLPYDAVRPRIAEALEKAAWARSAAAFTRRLVAAAEVSGIEMAGE